MTQLNQIIALEKGVKQRADQALTKAYHDIQSTPRLSGISRTYRPKDEEGDQLPAESTLVQVNAEQALANASADLIRLFDVQLTKDAANQVAKADIVIGTQVIASDVPVTYLLQLEKRLVDLRTFIGKLPTLDPAEIWTADANTGVYATQPTETTRTKKVLRNHVRAEATDKFPAQVDTYSEDVIVGYWQTIKFSGAVPATRVALLTRRIDALIEAVTTAREKANTITVDDREIGGAIFDYLLGA